MNDGHHLESLLMEQISSNSRLFFKLAHGILRQNEAAEDVCQQALLMAWSHRDRLKDRRALRSWLCSTIVNECLRIVRRRRLEGRVATQTSPLSKTHEPSSDDAADLRESVDIALESLPDELREVVVLRVMEGMKGNEVARMLGVSQATISRQLCEAIERLREPLLPWTASAGRSL